MITLNDYEDLFIFVYCFVADELEKMEVKPTRCRFCPAEILTIQIVGELMRKKTETEIHQLIYEYKDLFDGDISRSSFYKQLKKYSDLLPVFLVRISSKLGNSRKVKIIDSMPISTKKFVRAKRGNNLNGRAKVGYAASKKEYFAGMKLHLQTNINGIPEKAILSPGNVHDVKLAKDLIGDQRGIIFVGDKAYTSTDVRQHCSHLNSAFITPMKANQAGADEYNKAHKQFFKQRKSIEVTNSLLELLNVGATTARSFWSMLATKIVALGICCVFNHTNQSSSILSIKIVRFE
jgi:hypothetical protein